MKFVHLKSFGGDYEVVVENIAWLRAAENGQTSIGMVGSEPLQVATTVEETVAIIMGNQEKPREAATPVATPVLE